MEVLWRKSPLTAGEVIEQLPAGTKWAPNTVRTLLTRLTKKGALKFEESGNKYLYRPAFSRDQHVTDESASFIERLFGGRPKAMLLHFAESGKLTPKDIAELRRILEQKGDSR